MAKNLFKKNLGKIGETLTKKRLLKNNWTFLSSNFHTRFGEIDLIFLDQKNTLVFIEVKTRTDDKLGNPEQAITPKKISSLLKAASIFVQKNPKFQNHLYRLDAACINLKKKSFNYYQNITQ